MYISVPSFFKLNGTKRMTTVTQWLSQGTPLFFAIFTRRVNFYGFLFATLPKAVSVVGKNLLLWEQFCFSFKICLLLRMAQK